MPQKIKALLHDRDKMRELCSYVFFGILTTLISWLTYFVWRQALGLTSYPADSAAYMLIATIYAVVSRQRKTTVVLFAFICLGIWWTAVYSGHHYIIDVMLGIATTIVGIVLLEKVLLRLPTLQKGLQSYIAHI